MTRLQLVKIPTVVVALILMSGCARSSTGAGVPEPEPRRPVTPEPQPADIRGSGRAWQITPTNLPQTFISTLSANVVRVTGSGNTHDSLALDSRYTLTTSRQAGAQTAINGSIESISARAGVLIGTDSLPAILPTSFTGIVAPHEVRLQLSDTRQGDGSTQLPCGTAAQSALATVQRNLVVIPTELTVGMTWTDSTSSIACNGPVTMNLTTIRTYQLLGEVPYRGTPVLALDRTERVSSAGEGTSGQHIIRITGEALGKARIYVDRTTGSLLLITAENRSSLSIQASGRTEQFIQSSKETTTRSN